MEGMLIGTVIGGGVSWGVARQTCTSANDFCDLGVTLYGAAAGLLLGSAIGGSAPVGRGNCSRAQRFGLALTGSVLGAATGAAGILVSDAAGAVAILMLIPAGAAVLQGNC